MRIQAMAHATTAANEYQGHNLLPLAGADGTVGLFFVLDMQRLDYAGIIKGELTCQNPSNICINQTLGVI
jgi:hypothetical protein